MASNLDLPFSPRAVVAIDFGTSRSGYAFAFYNEPDEIYSQQTWAGGQTHHLKTLTNVLIKDSDIKEDEQKNRQRVKCNG